MLVEKMMPQCSHVLLLSFLQAIFSVASLLCTQQQFPAVTRALALPGDNWGSRGGSVFHIPFEKSEMFCTVLETLFYHWRPSLQYTRVFLGLSLSFYCILQKRRQHHLIGKPSRAHISGSSKQIFTLQLCKCRRIFLYINMWMQHRRLFLNTFQCTAIPN